MQSESIRCERIFLCNTPKSLYAPYKIPTHAYVSETKKIPSFQGFFITNFCISAFLAPEYAILAAAFHPQSLVHSSSHPLPFLISETHRFREYLPHL